MDNWIFIKGNVPSLKNNRQIIKSKRVMMVYSPRCRKYILNSVIELILQKYKFKEIFRDRKPYIIGMYFVRKDKRNFDYDNVIQTVNETLKKAAYISDDNQKNIISVPLGYKIDKNNPGVYLFNIKKDFKKLFNKFVKNIKS